MSVDFCKIFIRQMNFRIHVKWSGGNYLPIIIGANTSVKDLMQMLHFAVGPNEYFHFSFKNAHLNDDDDTPIHFYGIKDGDTIDADILKKANQGMTNRRLQKAIESILLESAKLTDSHLNHLEYSNDGLISEPEPCDSEDAMIVHDFPTVIPPTHKEISTEPIPHIFLEQNQALEKDTNKDQLYFQSTEEASHYMDEHSDQEWRW